LRYKNSRRGYNLKVFDHGRWYYPITGVVSHGDLEGWELTIDFDGADRIIDIDYPLEEGDDSGDIAQPFADAVRVGYLLAFLDNNEAHVVSGVWHAGPDQSYIATIFSIKN
jgi:hypothetical protein